MKRTPFTLTSLITIITIALLATVYLIGLTRKNWESQNRIRCANNLRSLAYAIKFYANENRCGFPRTLHDRENPIPTWGTPYQANPNLSWSDTADPFAPPDAQNAKYRPAANDVTAGLFLLMRTQDITSEVFVCPSSNQTPFRFGGKTALHWTNWPGEAGVSAHLSYSYANPYLGADGEWTYKIPDILGTHMALLADKNPGTESLFRVKPSSAPSDLRRANSANHRGEGQNVAFYDGRVEFLKTPFTREGDNFFTFSTVNSDWKIAKGIIGPSAGCNDQVLLPTSTPLPR